MDLTVHLEYCTVEPKLKGGLVLSFVELGRFDFVLDQVGVYMITYFSWEVEEGHVCSGKGLLD